MAPRKHSVQQEDDDKGKIYFEKPLVIEINRSTTPENRVTLSPVNNVAGGETSPTVRTKTMQISPNSMKIPNYPKEVMYACSQHPSQREANEYIDRNEIHGFGEGSIVSRRWAHPWRFLYHHQWGILVSTRRTPGMAHDVWFPYRVKWFDSGMEEGTWAEDLLIVHACLDENLLMSIVEEQSYDTTEARGIIDKRNKGSLV